MNKSQIERFFKIVSEHYPAKCRIILTGAAAAALYGKVRPTLDVDFAANAANWELFSKAVKKAIETTGIAAQYAEDIDRWSSITLLDYARHTTPYARFGSIELRLMEPPYWAIGKLSRYLDQDIRDLVSVFKKTHTHWEDVAKIAGKALRKSPKSTSCFLFRKQVEHFFKTHANKAWNQNYDSESAVRLFQKAAGIS